MAPNRESQHVARETDAVCRDIGILGSTDQGVPEIVNTANCGNARMFFRWPAIGKHQVEQPAQEMIRGYIGVARDALAVASGAKTALCRKKNFSKGPGGPEAKRQGISDRSLVDQFASDRWPAAPPDFCKAWLAYYDEVTRLSADIMRLFAAAPSLDTNHFAPLIDWHISFLRAMLYLGLEFPPEPGQLSAGPHAVFGSLTTLRTDSILGCPQVQTKARDWPPSRRCEEVIF